MKKQFNLLARLSLAITVLVALLTPALANAFSAYGAGISANPYRIATCVQLQEIDNDLAGYYTLVSNIDCAGVAFTTIGDNTHIFTGTLDGQNHTISHLSIDDWGLFWQTNGATVKNISINSGSISGGYVASFVQDATDTTFTNIHSAMTLTNSSGYTGGLVGELKGTASVSQSSFSGTISGTGYVGGLVGASWDAGTSITDSYSSGSLSSHSGYEGGIIGGYFNGSINHVYSSMSINMNGNSYNGGLVGDSQKNVSNSFSSATMTGFGINDGAVIGLDNAGSYSNNYFDKYATNTISCFGLNGSGTCTGVNTGNTTPDYFKNNSTNAPLDTWDFTDVWATTSGYPTLQNISSFSTSSSDENADGIDDSYQANIVTVPDGNNILTTAVTPSSNGCTLDNGSWIDANYFKVDSGYTPQPPNMLAFKAYCPTSGMSIPVTIIYDKVYDTSSSVLRYFNDTTNTYSTITGAAFGTLTVSGTPRTTVTYNITDGGQFDSDGSSNGIIEDPVGLASSSSSTMLVDTGETFYLSTFASISLILITVFLYVKRPNS